MARPLRVEFEDAIYHLCARGNARQPIFHDERDRARFVELLSESARRFEAAVMCFVLMGNHFHLVAQTRRRNLRRWMHWLLVSYTVHFNRRHRSSGHLFQGRYKSFLVQEGNYLLALSRYVHLNPVRGVSLGKGTPSERRQRLRAFRWSSYLGYAGLKTPYPFVEEEMVLGELGCARRGERVRYRRFVEEGLVREVENPFEAVRWQIALGDETFMQRLRDRLKGHRHAKGEITALRQASRLAEPLAVVGRVAAHHGITVNKLLGEREYGSQAHNIAMWLLRQRGMTLRDIGALFGGINYPAVSQRIRRVQEAMARNRKLRRTSKILNV